MQLISFITLDAVLNCAIVVLMVRRCYEDQCCSPNIRCWSISAAAQSTSGGKNSTDDSQ